MQGIFINGRRPKSKAEIKRALADPAWPAGIAVVLEATSLFGNEYSGDVCAAPAGRYFFTGPDPHTSRKFYGTLIVSPAGTVKVA